MSFTIRHQFKARRFATGYTRFEGMGIVSLGIYCLIFSCVLKRSVAYVTTKYMTKSVINLPYGRVRGLLVEFPNKDKDSLRLKEVEAFKGLQFGSLKQNRLRFMPPKGATTTWDEIRKAVNDSRPCTQKLFSANKMMDLLPRGSKERLRRISAHINSTTEDCLYLNVYRPKEWNDTTKMPVMVFVHGESYDIGTGNAYDGSVLASYGEVIVVTVNYRLGVLGFLSTGDANANGNYALLDLLAVLTWLDQNIHEFGGDRNRITLFGHGYGAALVNILMLSPLVGENNFFQRAILQSGSALSSWAMSVDPKACAQIFAKRVNCSSSTSNDTKTLVECLRDTKTAEELVNNVPLPPKYYSCFAPTPSTGHGEIFPRPIDKLLLERLVEDREHRRSNRKPRQKRQVMFGVTKNEAYSFMKQSELENGISEYRKKQIIRTYVQNLFRYHRQKIFEILEHHYSEWDRVQNDSTRLSDIMQLLSDGQYVAPLVSMAQQYSKMTDTYFYAFGYSTKTERFPEWSSGVHGDELPYVFGAPIVDGISPFPSEYNNAEKKLSKSVMRFWTNFAKTGNPNLPKPADGSKFTGLEWPKYKINSQEYLLIGKRPQKKHHYRGKQLAVWLDLIPKINKADHKGPKEKVDPTRHVLENAHNLSLFDDHDRLLSEWFKAMFPSPPPIPPMTTYVLISDDPNEKLRSTQKPVSARPEDVTEDDRPIVGTFAPSNQEPPLAHSSVPLSITVAVGCSLLFLNILIFAGVYYQRERIKKLRRSESSNSEEMRMGRKIDRDGRAGGGGNQKGPETTSLMTSSQHNQLSPVKVVNTNTDQNPIYTAISKSSEPPSGGYSYTAVPTNSSSPMHRSKTHSQCNSIPSSTKSGSTISNTSGGGRPPDVSPRVENTRNTYKQDKYNQITSKDHPSSNNAITIV